MFNNVIKPQKYIPTPIFKNKMLRYYLYYFSKGTDGKKRKPSIGFEIVEGQKKEGNTRAREYKGENFRMNLSITEVAGLLGRIEYLNNNIDLIFSESGFERLKIGTNLILEHFPQVQNSQENSKIKTIFSFRLLEREVIINNYKESNLGWGGVSIVSLTMGKKGVSMTINLTRDELLKMKNDLSILYLLMFDLDTQFEGEGNYKEEKQIFANPDDFEI